MSSSSNITIEDLPLEIISMILGHFKQEEQSKLAEVCHAWYDLIYHMFSKKVASLNMEEQLELTKQSRVWRDVICNYLATLKRLEFDKTARRVMKECGAAVFKHVRMFNCTISDAQTGKDLVTLLSKVDGSIIKLHVVDSVRDWKNITVNATTELPPLMNLRSFQYGYTSTTSRYKGPTITEDDSNYSPLLAYLLSVLIHTKNRSLIYCHLSEAGYIKEKESENIVKLVHKCKSLKHFALYKCKLSWPYDEKCAMGITALAELQYLDLRQSNIEQNDKAFLEAIKKQCPKLETLGLPTLFWLTLSKFSALPRHRNVENTMLNNVFACANDDFRYLKLLSDVRCLGFIGLTHGELQSVIAHVSSRPMQVECLDLERCSAHITDDIVKSLVFLLRGVQILHLINCQHITEDCVAEIVKRAPDINIIAVINVQNISIRIRYLLRDLVTAQTKETIHIKAWGTKLSEQIPNTEPEYDRLDVTGKHENIHLIF